MNFIRNIKQSSLSDLELIAKYKDSRDAGWLTVLYDRYLELLYGVCVKYLKDNESAKDAVMELYLQLGDKILRHEIQHFRSWLYTVAKHHCLMQIRSTSRLQMVNISDDFMQSEEDLHQPLYQQKETEFTWLAQCMEKLSDDQKKVIELFYLQEKCYQEISDAVGFAWNKVRSLIQNGRRNLKICMEHEKNVAINENENLTTTRISRK